jgi:hypothetical protein
LWFHPTPEAMILTCSCTMSESFHVNFSSFGPVVLGRVFKIFFLYIHMFLMWPYPTPRVMILTNLILKYVRNLSCKYQFFLAQWFLRRFYKYFSYTRPFLVFSPFCVSSKLWNLPASQGKKQTSFEKQSCLCMLYGCEI